MPEIGADRVEALRALANWDGSLQQIQADLARGETIFDIVQLNVQQVCDVVRRYLLGELDAPISEWATTVLFTDDLEYEPIRGAEIAELLFRLANPEIEGGELTPAEARRWLELRCGH